MNATAVITELIDRCQGFQEDIFGISVINTNFDNPSQCSPECINSNSANWRNFVNDINCLDLKIGAYSSIFQLKNLISGLSVIDETALENILVELNNINNDIQTNNLSNQNDTNCSVLKQLLNEMDILKKNFSATQTPGLPNVKTIYNDESFVKWKAKLKYELQQYNKDEYVLNILNELEKFIGWNDEKLFNNIQAELEVLCDNVIKENNYMDKKKIFIVHGRNEAIRDKVEAFVRRIGLNPIILCKEASKGQSILDKIISYSDVGFALVLYTGCDEGRLRGANEECKPRARQNVVFEHGYMIAHLSKDRVVALIEDDSVEIPGDYSGVVYIKLSDLDWETQVKRELHAANIEFDPYA